MQSFSLDIQQLGRLARRDLERACRHFLGLEPADRQALVDSVRAAPPLDWPEDLLGVLVWLEAQYERLALQTPPEEVLADAFQLERVRHSPIQLLHRPLEPGDEISEVLARRLGRALVHLGGEGDRLISVEEAELHLGTQLGFLRLSRPSLHARRATGEEQTALQSAWRALQELKTLRSSAAKGLELRFQRLLTLRSEDHASTLPRLEALTGLKRNRLWLEVIEFQRRQSLPADRRPSLLWLSERLEQVGIQLELPHLGRLAALASSILARLMPDPEVASGVVQLKAPDLEEYLRWEIGSRHLARYHSTAGVHTLNELLLTLASQKDVPGYPAELLAELVEMREVFLMRLYEKPVLPLLALDPATFLRRALHPEPEHLWPELPTPGAMVEAWTDLERAIAAKLHDVRMQPMAEPTRARGLTDRILSDKGADRGDEREKAALERSTPSSSSPRLLPAALRRPGSMGALAQPSGPPIPLVPELPAPSSAADRLRPIPLKPGSLPGPGTETSHSTPAKAPGVYRRSNEQTHPAKTGVEQWVNPLEPAIPWPSPPLGDSDEAMTDGIEGTALEQDRTRQRSPLPAPPPADGDDADDILEHDDTISVIVSLDSVALDSVALDSVSLDSVSLDSVSLDSVSLDSVALDSITEESAAQGPSSSASPFLPFSTEEPEVELAPALELSSAQDTPATPLSPSAQANPSHPTDELEPELELELVQDPEKPILPDDSPPELIPSLHHAPDLQPLPGDVLAIESGPLEPASTESQAIETPPDATSAERSLGDLLLNGTDLNAPIGSPSLPVTQSQTMVGLLEALMHQAEPTLPAPEQASAPPHWVEDLGLAPVVPPADAPAHPPLELALTDAILSEHAGEGQGGAGTGALLEASVSGEKGPRDAQLEDILAQKVADEPASVIEPSKQTIRGVELEAALSLSPIAYGGMGLGGSSLSGLGSPGFSLSGLSLSELSTTSPTGLSEANLNGLSSTGLPGISETSLSGLGHAPMTDLRPLNDARLHSPQQEASLSGIQGGALVLELAAHAPEPPRLPEPPLLPEPHHSEPLAISRLQPQHLKVEQSSDESTVLDLAALLAAQSRLKAEAEAPSQAAVPTTSPSAEPPGAAPEVSSSSPLSLEVGHGLQPPPREAENVHAEGLTVRSTHELELPPLQPLDWDGELLQPPTPAATAGAATGDSSHSDSHPEPPPALSDSAPSAPDPGGQDGFFFDGINLILYEGDLSEKQESSAESDSAHLAAPHSDVIGEEDADPPRVGLSPRSTDHSASSPPESRPPRLPTEHQEPEHRQESSSPLEDAALWLNSTPMDPSPIHENDTAFSDPLAIPPAALPRRVPYEPPSAFVKRSTPNLDRVAYPEPPSEPDEEQQLEGAVFGVEASTEEEEELSDPLPMPEGGAELTDDESEAVEADDDDRTVPASLSGRGHAPFHMDYSSVQDEIERLMETLESAESLAAASTPWPVPWGNPPPVEEDEEPLDPLEALERAEGALQTHMADSPHEGGQSSPGRSFGASGDRGRSLARPEDRGEAGSSLRSPTKLTGPRPALNLASRDSSRPAPTPTPEQPEFWETPRED